MAVAAAAAAAVIAAADFSVSLHSTLLGTTSVDRKISIGLHNNSKDEWSAPRVHFVSGTSDAGLLGAIKADHVLLFAARKTNGSFRGTAGVMTYYLPGRNVTVALMWSVPYDYSLYSNWWNLEVLSGDVQASDSLFHNLYDDWSPHAGDSNFYSGTSLNGTWRYEGSMGASGAPTMDIYVSPS